MQEGIFFSVVSRKYLIHPALIGKIVGTARRNAELLERA